MASVLLQAARDYARRGWCLIPMLPTGKQPAVRWKRYQTQRPSASSLASWFGGADAYGMAVVFGDISGNLGSRDFDDLPSYRVWSAAHADLAAVLPTVRTHRGRHVYFQTDPQDVADFRASIGKPGGTGAIHLEDGELRIGTGCYSLVPPSPHPKGGVYAWEIPPGPTLPVVTDFHRSGFCRGCHREDRGRQRTTEDIKAVEAVSLQETLQEFFLINNLLLPPSSSSRSDLAGSPEGGELPAEVARAIAATRPSRTGQRNRLVFEFARWLKALPDYRDADPRSLDDVVRQWHQQAKPFIGTPDFEETLIDFRKGWAKVKHPRGMEPMAEIVAKAFAAAVPEVAEKYESEPVRRLTALCRELQRAAGAGPFYLSCHTAGRLLGADPKSANRWLFFLEDEGILQTVEKGSNRTQRATRYRYLPPL